MAAEAGTAQGTAMEITVSKFDLLKELTATQGVVERKTTIPILSNFLFEAAGDKAQALFDAAEKDGTRAKPEYGSVWYHLMGADKDHTRTHMTIAVPGATTQSTGLPDNNKQGGVWIMNAGTTTAHLMTPGE